MHLDRLIFVLETVAAAGRTISAGDLQSATGLARPTCYRLLQSLKERGLLSDPANNSRYQIGERLLRIALLGRSDLAVQRVAVATLRDAADHFGEATFLSRLRNGEVEIIQVEVPTDPKRAYIHPGLGLRPMHACSCSKVIAAFSSSNLQRDILRRPMKAYTGHTKTDGAELTEEFARIRSQGYAECVEEIESGVASVAAPVMVGPLGAAFSVGTIGPIRRFTKAHRESLGSALIGHATAVGTALEFADGCV